MNEALEQALLDLIAYIKQGATFVETQAPLVAQEYLRYWTIASCFGIGVGLALLGIALYSRFRIKRWTPEDWIRYDQFCPWYFPVVIGVLLGSSLTIYWTLELIRIKVAPRLYLLEGLKSLMK